MCQTNLTFSLPNSRHKQVKFDLILNKSVRLQFQEVKDDIFESPMLNSNIEDTLIYHMASSATIFFKFMKKINLFES